MRKTIEIFTCDGCGKEMNPSHDFQLFTGKLKIVSEYGGTELVYSADLCNACAEPLRNACYTACEKYGEEVKNRNDQA